MTLSESFAGLDVLETASDIATFLEAARTAGDVVIGALEPVDTIIKQAVLGYWSAGNDAPDWLLRAAAGTLPSWLVNLSNLVPDSGCPLWRIQELFNLKGDALSPAQALKRVWDTSDGSLDSADTPADCGRDVPEPAPRPDWLYPPTVLPATDTIAAQWIVAPIAGALAGGPVGGWKSMRKDQRPIYYYKQGATNPAFSKIVGLAVCGGGAVCIDHDVSSEADAIARSLRMLNRLRNEGQIFVVDAPLFRHLLLVRAAVNHVGVNDWFTWRNKGADWLHDTRRLGSPFFDAISLGALAVASGYTHNSFENLGRPIVYAEEPDFVTEATRHITTLCTIIDHERPVRNLRSTYSSAA